MKKIILPLLFACAILALSSCNEKDGKCGTPPRFSSEVLNFDVNGGSGVISGDNDAFWSIYAIAIDDSCFYRYECGQVGSGSCQLIMSCDSIYYSGDTDHQHPVGRVIKFEGAWFSVTVEHDVHRNPQSLSFSVQTNNTGKSRKLQVFTSTLNCSSPALTVTQSAE